MSFKSRHMTAAVCVVAFSHFASGQGARIVRPSVVAKGSRQISIRPTLAGFKIGESLQTSIPRLGEQVQVEKLGDAPDAPVSYHNPQSGITLIGGASEGVGIILITHRESGDLDGIQIGDSKGKVIAKWGRYASGDELNGLWLAGEFVVSIRFDKNGLVNRIGVGLGQ